MTHEDIGVQIDQNLFREFGIRLAYLFGSAARGDAGQRDTDIALLLDSREPDVIEENEIAERFRKRLIAEKSFDAAIHIATLNSANPLLRFEAIKEGKVLYARSEAERVDFELKVLREYGDYKAKSRFYEDALRERLRGKTA